MQIKIRKAAEADCPRMMELIRELAHYERAPGEVVVSMDHFIDSGFGKEAVWKAFVAESAPGEVIGFALYYIRYSTWKGQRMYLEDLIVTEKMRGMGAGKMLFDSLLAECRRKEYSGLVWQVLDWNEPAINFYNKYPDVQFDKGWLNCAINL